MHSNAALALTRAKIADDTVAGGAGGAVGGQAGLGGGGGLYISGGSLTLVASVISSDSAASTAVALAALSLRRAGLVKGAGCAQAMPSSTLAA